MEPVIVSIDTSQRYLGWSYQDTQGNPIRFGWIEQNTANHVEWHRRSAFMSNAVSATLERYYADDGMKPVVVILEVPNNWHTERGQNSKNSEAVQKLYFTAGAIAAALKALPFVHSVYIILPFQWKGQVDKNIIRKRFQSFCNLKGIIGDLNVPTEQMEDDAFEAVMLGNYAHSRQEEEDDGSVTFMAPFSCISKQGDLEGSFNYEVYYERSANEPVKEIDEGEEAYREHTDPPY